ncbi:acyl-CoA N-acyltransferase [Heliocybe sulcata]|uniref:Acyl-CoA N-acyltransferase n=1 Tax=Heliocybe sulcata TaxID=5364 RepID=A0A5C3N956_9AGAM|nr:acyl-CoA N-acyltransferase [Heliocybe sulcata]
MFETERIILRGAGEADFPLLLEMYNDPTIQRYMDIRPVAPYPPSFVENLKTMHEDAVLGVVLQHKASGAFMGEFRFTPTAAKDREVFVAICLKNEWQGTGYGTEVMKSMIRHAFVNLGMHRLSLNVFDGNNKAKVVYEKLGFVEECRVRKKNWVEGQWEDMVVMGMLESDWQKLPWKDQVRFE